MRITWEISDESIRFVRFTARSVSLSLRDLDELEECLGVEVITEMHYGEEDFGPKEVLFAALKVPRWATINILCRKKRGYPRLHRNWLTFHLSDDGRVLDTDGKPAEWEDDVRDAA